MANLTTRTDSKTSAFLSALAECGNVSDACRKTGIPRATAYEWRDSDSGFADEWRKARAIGVELLEDEAVRRAYTGVERPVYQGGRQVGAIREYSDTLLIFLLKGAKPDVYRDNAKVEHTGSVGVTLVHSVPRPSATDAASSK